MESRTNNVDLDSISESVTVEEHVPRTETFENEPNVDSPRNSLVEEALSDDNTSSKSIPHTEQKQTNIMNTSSTKNVAQKATVSQSNVIKNLVNEMKEMKVRMRKLEDEVGALHELLKVQDDITAETLANLPDNFEDQNRPVYRKRSLPHHDFHKVDKDTGSLNISQAMMMNNHAWYGDAFLFELMCQFKGYQPKEDNWFTSIYPFVAFETFCKRMFNRKKFYPSCVVCVGYSDLFNAKPVTGFPMKQTLHALLNYMNEHGAEHIKVLSIPPARQMMKNTEYLKICQTTNKFFKAITKTHTFVDFINLDGFFLDNGNESFNYFENNEVQVHIRGNLLMRKVNDHFEIFIEPQTAKEVIEYVVDYSYSTRGYQTNNGYNDMMPSKRRSESVSSPNYPAKRIHKSRPSNDEYSDHSYKSNPSDRYSINDYEQEKSYTTDEYQQSYELDQRSRSNSRSERSSPPPWLKK